MNQRQSGSSISINCNRFESNESFIRTSFNAPVSKLLADASGLGARSKSIRNLESPTTEDDDNRPAPSITNSY
jgi:hypothetical protein